jgi:hypothetical protein
MQLDLQVASRVPLLRTPPEGFCSSSYKHATPNGVKTVTHFFTASDVVEPRAIRDWVDKAFPLLF